MSNISGIISKIKIGEDGLARSIVPHYLTNGTNIISVPNSMAADQTLPLSVNNIKPDAAGNITIDNPIVDADLDRITPVDNTYYRHKSTGLLPVTPFVVGERISGVYFATNMASEAIDTILHSFVSAENPIHTILETTIDAGYPIDISIQYLDEDDDIYYCISCVGEPIYLSNGVTSEWNYDFINEINTVFSLQGENIIAVENQSFMSATPFTNYDENVIYYFKDGAFNKIVGNIIIEANLADPEFVPEYKTYYRHTGANVGNFTAGVIYFYTYRDGDYKFIPIDGGAQNIIDADLNRSDFTPKNGTYYRHTGNTSAAVAFNRGDTYRKVFCDISLNATTVKNRLAGCTWTDLIPGIHDLQAAVLLSGTEYDAATETPLISALRVRNTSSDPFVYTIMCDGAEISDSGLWISEEGDSVNKGWFVPGSYLLKSQKTATINLQDNIGIFSAEPYKFFKGEIYYYNNDRYNKLDNWELTWDLELAFEEVKDQIRTLDTEKQDVIDSDNKLNYNLLYNTPNIPAKTSDLTNDSGFITSADIPSIPTKTSDLTNDGSDGEHPYLVQHQDISGKANDIEVVHKTGEETIQDHKTFSRTINGVTNQLSLNETQYDIFTCRDTTNPENKTAIAKGYVWCQDQNGDRYSQFKPEGIYYGKDSTGYEVDVAFPTDKSGSQVFAMCSDLPTKTSELTNDSDFITSSYHDSTKQDTISDIATIRSQASGAMPKSGGTFTGQVKFNVTSQTYNNGNIIGSKQADATTLPNLLEELRYTNGQMGSLNLGTSYTLSGVTIGTGWYNYIYVPHRGGGNSGAASDDNTSYGSLFLKGMTMDTPIYTVRFSSGSINSVYSTHTFTLSGTTLTIS